MKLNELILFYMIVLFSYFFLKDAFPYDTTIYNIYYLQNKFLAEITSHKLSHINNNIYQSVNKMFWLYAGW